MILPNNRFEFRPKNDRFQRRKVKKSRFLIIAVLVVAVFAAAFMIFLSINNNKNASHQVVQVEETQGRSLEELWADQMYSEVNEYCEKILEQEPLSFAHLLYNGFAYFYRSVNRFSHEEQIPLLDQSIENLRKARILDDQPNGKIDYVLGKAYYHKGKYYLDESVFYLGSSLEYGYAASDTYKYLGLAYSELNEYELCVEYFLKAIQYDYSDSDIALLYLSLAKAYYQLQNMESSKEYLIRTINKSTDHVIIENSRFLLGSIYRDQEDYIKAEDEYKKILENNDKAADAHYFLGIIYNQTKNDIGARAEFRKALEIDPSHHGARKELYN